MGDPQCHRDKGKQEGRSVLVPVCHLLLHPQEIALVLHPVPHHPVPRSILPDCAGVLFAFRRRRKIVTFHLCTGVTDCVPPGHRGNHPFILKGELSVHFEVSTRQYLSFSVFSYPDLSLNYSRPQLAQITSTGLSITCIVNSVNSIKSFTSDSDTCELHYKYTDLKKTITITIASRFSGVIHYNQINHIRHYFVLNIEKNQIVWLNRLQRQFESF